MTWFLVLYFLVFVGVAMGLRSWLVWRQTGVNPVIYDHPDPAHRYLGATFVALMAGTGGAVLVSALGGARLLAPLDLPAGAATVGVGLLVAALSLVLVAQAQMGSAWRVGIDPRHETELVRVGLFGWSRNPVFLGMQLALLGLFLCLPAAATLLSVVVGHVVLQVQVRLEEQHLLAMHAEDYRRFSAAVPRWFGPFGRGAVG